MAHPAPPDTALDGPEFDLVAPRADCLVESLRAINYELPTAVADLVDNSVAAGARHIWIDFFWDGPGSTITVTDDGRGLSEAALVAAMRLGSMSPLQRREPHDLGRFGLGLKTASFSQCRCLTVLSRTSDGQPVMRRWDLDHVSRRNEWELLRHFSVAHPCFARLRTLEHGTVVAWSNIDRITTGQSRNSDRGQDNFLRQAQGVGKHLAVVFHEIMRGPRGVQLIINDQPLEPWDPFLQDEPATQVLPTTSLTFRNSTITVQPFVLPHHSKISVKRLAAAQGPLGWNAHQGFYVYRARRLLVPGDWLGLGWPKWPKDEHFKLARIRLEIPNELDHDWAIDVTKSRASPPAELRDELTKIAERTRDTAKRVYSFRGAKLTPASDVERIFLWEPVVRHDTVAYRLNREHPLIKQAFVSSSDSGALSALLRLVEETLPAAHITIQNTEKPTSLRGPFEGVSDAQVRDVMEHVLRALCKAGGGRQQAIERLRSLWPFELFPALLETLT